MLMHWIARHLAMPSYSVEASCGRQLEVLGCRHPGGHGYLHRLRHISSRGRSDRVRPGLDVAQRVEAIAVVVVRVFLEQRQEVAVGRTRRAAEITKVVRFLDGAQRPLPFQPISPTAIWVVAAVVPVDAGSELRVPVAVTSSGEDDVPATVCTLWTTWSHFQSAAQPTRPALRRQYAGRLTAVPCIEAGSNRSRSAPAAANAPKCHVGNC